MSDFDYAIQRMRDGIDRLADAPAYDTAEQREALDEIEGGLADARAALGISED